MTKPEDSLQHRICLTKYAANEPGFRAAVSGRFDDPIGVYETLYCAPTFGICYAETLMRGRFNHANGQYEVPKLEHDIRSLSVLVVDFAKLKIVDLFGSGLRAMGLDNSIPMDKYSETRNLSRAIYDHADAPDGMMYQSRFAVGRQPAIVLFDRAKPHVRRLPGFFPVPLTEVQESFTALTQEQQIALI